MALRPVREVERRFWRMYERFSPHAQDAAVTGATLLLAQESVAILRRVEAALNVDAALARIAEERGRLNEAIAAFELERDAWAANHD